MRRTPLALAAAASCVAAFVAPTAALAAPAHPRINQTLAFDAPTEERGGIMTPLVSCSDYRIEPRVRSTISAVDGTYRKTFRWTGSYPGAYFPRVAVGEYKVITVAKCDGVRRSRTQVVEVVQKTPETTISRSEFKRVQAGMTRAEVEEVVGYAGTSVGTYRRTESRLYDNMKFWSWSIIEYRRGIVYDKYFNVGHD